MTALILYILKEILRSAWFKRTVFFSFVLINIRVVAGESILVKGNVCTPTDPVQNASIIFTNQSNSLKTFSTFTDSAGNFELNLVTSIEDRPSYTPQSFKLAQNYPNPFSSSTAISYQLNKQTNVRIGVYDILGREVKTFAIRAQTIGTYGVVWDGKDNFGRKVATGVYFYRLESATEIQVKKMLIGVGSMSNGVIHPLRFIPSTSGFKKLQRTSLDTGLYTVQIQNISGTTPTAMASAEFRDMPIQGDTSLKFIMQDLTIKALQPLSVGNYWKYIRHRYDYIDSQRIVKDIDSTIIYVTGETQISYEEQQYNVALRSKIFLQTNFKEEVEWLYLNGDSGLYWFGGISATDSMIFNALHFKFPVDSGIKWQVPNLVYVVNSAHFIIEDTLTVTCEGTRVGFQTPVGNYSCYVYHYRMRIADDVIGFWEIYEYYLPGIGLIGTGTRMTYGNDDPTIHDISYKAFLFDFVIN